MTDKLTEQQFSALTSRLRNALKDPTTPEDVRNQLQNWAERIPELRVNTFENVLAEASSFFSKPFQEWTIDELRRYGTWARNHAPEASE